LFGDIAGLFGAAKFDPEGGEDFLFNLLPAIAIDGMRDVAVHFDAFAVGDHGGELCPALIAEAGMEMVFGAAGIAARHDFAGRHRDKKAVGSVDDFDIADDKTAIEGNAAKSAQPILALRRELDGDIGDFHVAAPVRQNNSAKVALLG
jgi:hypothetical protein